uniref:Uncharacterized protein n=1 Tax=Romanomermis culicivorax TaxID=13658 RepID=A0A915KN75_ROMCU
MASHPLFKIGFESSWHMSQKLELWHRFNDKILVQLGTSFEYSKLIKKLITKFIKMCLTLEYCN